MLISQTPLRISLAGGGTDLRAYYKDSDGFVVSTAIDKYMYVLIKERFDSKIYLNYAARKEIVDDISEIQHELVREAGINGGPAQWIRVGHVCRYSIGRIRARFFQQPDRRSAQCHVHLSRPSGNTRQLAEEACMIEIEVLKNRSESRTNI